MKYIAYCRKSTDEKDKQVLSIDAQIAELKEFAKKQNLEILDFVVESRTAKVPGRPLFNEILVRIEKGEAQGIVSWHPDRLARNSVDGGKIIYSLDTGKLVDLKFPSFWFENSPQGKFVLNIAFGQSKYYVDNLSENVKRGMRHKVRIGVWPVQAPLGYLNDKNTKTIVIDPVRSKITKKVFEMFESGKHSFTSISEYLFKLGITTRLGRKLNPDTIKRMLSNRFYLGILNYKGELHKGIHKPIISKTLFDSVQKQIVKFERPREHGHDFPFVGLAKCGECGASITGEEHARNYKNGNSQTFAYYRCTKKLGKCSQKYISQEEFEHQLKEELLDVAIPQGWWSDWLAWVERDKINETKLASQRVVEVGEEMQEVDRKLNKLLDTYLDSVVDEEQYKAKKNELFEQKLKLQEKISKIQSGGSSWLEPFEEFLKSSINCGKIALGKNNLQELRILARNAGSNFFLSEKRLSFVPNLGFDSVKSWRGSRPSATAFSAKSESVSRERLELSTNRLRGDCSTD